MFRGMDGQTGRLGSRPMKPPGGESSDHFRSLEERIPSTCKPNRMASNIFGPPEEPKNISKRINPPGGKGSGIFDELTPVKTRQYLNPPGGKASDIFGSPITATAPLAHPNKPKDHVLLREGEDSKSDPSTTTNTTPRGERAKKPESTSTADNHEPRMGPRPRSHNKVLNPPGGKSSISFY